MPSKARSPRKQASGGARLRAAGKIAVLLGLDPEQAAIIRTAARADNRPVTQFLIHHGLAAAKKIIHHAS